MEEIREDIISFKTAKSILAKGFDLNGHTNDEVSPTLALIQKWFRKNYKLNIYADLCEDGKWKCVIRNFTDIIDDDHRIVLAPFETYEMAINQGLQKATKLI